MAFLALGPADIFHRYRVAFSTLQVRSKFRVDAIKFISGLTARAVGEIDPARPMTIDAPAHAQRRELVNLIHVLDRAMTGLALHLTRMHMLRVAEENMIGQVMDTNPFHGLPLAGIAA